MQRIDKEQMIEDANQIIEKLTAGRFLQASEVEQVGNWQIRYTMLQDEYEQREQEALTERYHFCTHCGEPLQDVVPKRAGVAWERICSHGHTLWYVPGNRGRVSFAMSA
jgi:hypothetical protein